MPADPQYDQVNVLAKYSSPVYGCHNKPRPIPDQSVSHSQVLHNGDKVSWPYRFTVTCQFDMWETDIRCAGCKFSPGMLTASNQLS